MSSEKKHSVVILGAGFGGIAAARTLAQSCADLKVTVIDRSAFHVFTPLLYEAATGFVEHENIGTAKLLHTGVTVDCASLFAPWGVDFVNDSVTGVDWDRREVHLAAMPPVHFDDLLIAFGAEVNFYGIEGMKEHSLVLKTVHDADRLRQHVHDLLHMKETGKRETFNIVIGGGGATGIELACELTMFLRKHMAKGHLKVGDFHITVVEASPQILGVMGKTLSAFARERLRNLGIHLHLDTAVQKVEQGRVTLAPRACKPGETIDQLLCDFRHEGLRVIDADMVVWCGGIRGSASLEMLGVPLDQRGKRIEVGATLEVAGRQGVYVAGDSALLIDPSTKQPVPWLAQAAIAMGETAANSVLARMQGGEAVAFRFPKFPAVVPLGGKNAVAMFAGRHYTGWIAWALHEAATLQYFLGILPFFTALTLWWRGVVIYTRND